ncbi:MAG: sensor domain-containing diguanylate cyclase [Bacillota bacterium]|jgi:diguanylate cyclase (GGDEF)-like protein
MIQLLVMAIVIGLALFLVWHSRREHSFYRELYELEEAFEGGLDFSQLAKRILAQVIRKTTASGGILYWFDEAQKEFKLKTLVGITTAEINRVTAVLREPHGILEQGRITSDSYLVRDLGKAQRLSKPDYLEHLSDFGRSIMVISLASRKIPRGLMVLFRAKENFNARYLSMLKVFAARAAVNLDNARLYQLTKETAMENTRLYLNISKLYKQATLDELTGLYNRNFFMQRIKEEVKKAWRLKQPLALLFIDLDYFKRINDQFGHQVGDQLLLEFGNFLKTLIREYDVPCRFGGEEFILLLPHTDLAAAFNLAERLRRKLAAHQFEGSLREVKVTASFGVNSLADFPGALAQLNDEKVAESVEVLVSGADEALYRAKNAGRNQVRSLQVV